MTDLIYTPEERNTGTKLGLCAGCGGTLWQSNGQPERCDKCPAPKGKK